jgi:lysophospholipase L1-like esterase
MARGVRILCVGDSLTEGHFGGYPILLQELLVQREPNIQWTVDKCAKIGSTTKDWLNDQALNAQLKTAMAKGCDIIVLMLGTNDCQTGLHFSEQQFISSWTQLARRLMQEAPGAALLVATPPPVVPGGSFAQYFDVNIINSVLPRLVPRVAASLGLQSIDCFSALGGSSPHRQAYSDGVHLNKEGYKSVGAAISSSILRSVCGLSCSVKPPTQYNTASQNQTPQTSQTPSFISSSSFKALHQRGQFPKSHALRTKYPSAADVARQVTGFPQALSNSSYCPNITPASTCVFPGYKQGFSFAAPVSPASALAPPARIDTTKLCGVDATKATGFIPQFCEGQRVEYKGRSSGQWSYGVISQASSSGYTVSLGAGQTKHIPSADALMRLR